MFGMFVSHDYFTFLLDNRWFNIRSIDSRLWSFIRLLSSSFSSTLYTSRYEANSQMPLWVVQHRYVENQFLLVNLGRQSLSFDHHADVGSSSFPLLLTLSNHRTSRSLGATAFQLHSKQQRRQPRISNVSFDISAKWTARPSPCSNHSCTVSHTLRFWRIKSSRSAHRKRRVLITRAIHSNERRCWPQNMQSHA